MTVLMSKDTANLAGGVHLHGATAREQPEAMAITADHHRRGLSPAQPPSTTMTVLPLTLIVCVPVVGAAALTRPNVPLSGL